MITNGTDQLSDATVGVAYEVGLFPGGGVHYSPRMTPSGRFSRREALAILGAAGATAVTGPINRAKAAQPISALDGALARNDAIYPGNGFQRQFCGGTLVAPTIVITAAHCVFDNPLAVVGFNPANQFEVFTGRTNLSSAEGQAIDVAELYYFEGVPTAPVLQHQSADPSPSTGQLYNPTTNEWDAVFLQLSPPSRLRIAPPTSTAA